VHHLLRTDQSQLLLLLLHFNGESYATTTYCLYAFTDHQNLCATLSSAAGMLCIVITTAIGCYRSFALPVCIACGRLAGSRAIDYSNRSRL
jgi:hypothetical protein